MNFHNPEAIYIIIYKNSSLLMFNLTSIPSNKNNNPTSIPFNICMFHLQRSRIATWQQPNPTQPYINSISSQPPQSSFLPKISLSFQILILLSFLRHCKIIWRQGCQDSDLTYRIGKRVFRLVTKLLRLRSYIRSVRESSDYESNQES